jgi:hypothetical protein
MVAITELYPRISGKMIVDPLGSVEHTLGNTELSA